MFITIDGNGFHSLAADPPTFCQQKIEEAV